MENLVWIIIVVGWIIDRVLKLVVQDQFIPGESVALIPNIFHFTYVLNPGAAFGLLAGQTWVFIVSAVIALGVIVYMDFHIPRRDRLKRVALGLIGSGALGNLFDRITTGKVVDYFDFRLNTQIWSYIFNFADVMIVVGVGLLLLAFWREERKERRLRAEEGAIEEPGDSDEKQ